MAASSTQTASDDDPLADSKITESTRAVLKALLVATAGVAGTEGYRVRQRHLGFSMNLLFDPCVLFFTLNFADTRSPIVAFLDDGPDDIPNRRKVNIFKCI